MKPQELVKKIADFVENLIEHTKGLILLLVFAVAVLGGIAGYRYYRHTQDDPEFCTSCHMMGDAFTEWRKGKHRDIVCQSCHQLNMLEQNQILIAYVFRGTETKFSETHGRKKPWVNCRKCHMDEASQGSVTMRKSYGHARHVFMQKIDCKVCHKNTLHNFLPNETACQNCHADKGVHGIGMEAFSCLKCHSFSEKAASMVPQDRCIKCHGRIDSNSPMSGLLCHQCHRPHGKVKQTSESCMATCHRNETAVGQHGLHMKKGLGCLDCHKPHTWTVGKEKSLSLCSRCHPYKDPKRFIY